MTALALTDLTTFDDEEPRIRDLLLAERLGFERSTSVRVLIRNHAEDLRRYGALHQSNAKTGGRPGQEYYLNEGQALRLCTLSRTDRAAEITHQVITVYQAYRKGQLQPAGFNLENLVEAVAARLERTIENRVQARIEQDPRVAVGAFRQTLQLLIDWGITEPKGRRGMSRSVGVLLRRYCIRRANEGMGSMPRLDPHAMREVWLYPIDTANQWYVTEGKGWIDNRLAERSKAKGTQTVLNLVPRLEPLDPKPDLPHGEPPHRP